MLLVGDGGRWRVELDGTRPWRCGQIWTVWIEICTSTLSQVAFSAKGSLDDEPKPLQ